MSLFIHQMCKL